MRTSDSWQSIFKVEAATLKRKLKLDNRNASLNKWCSCTDSKATDVFKGATTFSLQDLLYISVNKAWKTEHAISKEQTKLCTC